MDRPTLRSSRRPDQPLRVAIIGSRGYPSYYGGFETLVRRLAPHLVDSGWDVTVYGRSGATRPDDPLRDPRVSTRTTWGLETKSLSTLSFGCSASLHALATRPDVALVMNCANGFWLPLLRLGRIPTVVNVDGIEWEREKWNRAGKALFHRGAVVTARFADNLLYDAEAIRQYWLGSFGRDGTVIPYGGEIPGDLPCPEGLRHRGYALMVARFVPENTVTEFLEAAPYLSRVTDVVIVGSSGYGGDLETRVAALAAQNPRIHWYGHLSDDEKLHALWRHAGVYFHGHSVGGTNPALVQAMACGAPIVARDTVYNRETLDGAGVIVPASVDAIREALLAVLSDPGEQERLSAAAEGRADRAYRWSDVRRQYSDALLAAVGAEGEPVRDPAVRHLRVMPELRSERISIDPLLTPAVTLYFDTNFDVVGIEIPPNFRRTNLPRAIAQIALSRASVLELPEPLWARFLPRNVCLALAWTVSGLVRGRWRRARTYAIENNDPVSALLGDRAVPPLLAAALRGVLGLVIRLLFEQIAFGTDGAARVYGSLPAVRHMPQRTFPELPCRPARPDPRSPANGSAVFVGHLSERKGLSLLLDAWSLVEAQRSEAHLHVVGSGPLDARVTEWAQERPGTRTFHGHLPRRAVLDMLPTIGVLAAPSIRWGRWREQVGQPIQEALAAGLTVVTTTETGLALWLRAHGHHVLETPLSAGTLATELIRALDVPLPRQQVLDSLPVDLERREADRWLHS